jgi:hypothetical protein
MKVYIGPYKDWFGPYQAAKLLRYLGFSEETCDKIGDWLPEKLFEFIDKMRGERRVKVKIHEYDTWSMDNTLAYIVLPMLKQLKETKHGSPFVDDEDVPEELRSTSAPPKENEWDTDDNHHDRWNWVLDEMIFAFETQLNNWDEKFFQNNHFDVEGYLPVSKRITNGYRLFGKYYQALWD